MDGTADLDAVVAALGLERHRVFLAESGADDPPLPSVAWPDEDTVGQAAVTAGLSTEVRHACVACARWIAAAPARSRYLWHLYHRLFRRSGATVESARACPDLGHLGPPGPLAGAVLCLLAVDGLVAAHRRRRVPAAVTSRTLGDLELWIHEYHARTGVWGFAELGWMWRHLSDRVVQIGRLQYELRTFPFDYHVFVRPGGAPVVLAGDGMRFRSDGQHADAAGAVADGSARRVCFARTPGGWMGERMDPDGGAAGEVVALSQQQWAPCLQMGGMVTAVHIPAGGPPPGNGPMTDEACEASLEQAGPFLARHYPEHATRVFSCTSWLMDPQLRAYLPPASNIVRFQDRFYRLPVPGAGPEQHYDRVFGAKEIPLDRAAGGTMGRILREHVERGGAWRMGLGLIPEGGTRWRRA